MILNKMEDNKILYTKSGKIRKRKPKVSNTYFTDETQDAILLYVSLEDQEQRNIIYKNKIEYAFFKLTQNLIHTFKFYYMDGESVEDVQQEVISFPKPKSGTHSFWVLKEVHL